MSPQRKSRDFLSNPSSRKNSFAYSPRKSIGMPENGLTLSQFKNSSNFNSPSRKDTSEISRRISCLSGKKPTHFKNFSMTFNRNSNNDINYMDLHAKLNDLKKGKHLSRGDLLTSVDLSQSHYDNNISSPRGLKTLSSMHYDRIGTSSNNSIIFKNKIQKEISTITNMLSSVNNSRINKPIFRMNREFRSSSDVLLSTVSSHKGGLITRNILNHFNPSAKDKAMTKLADLHFKQHIHKDEELKVFSREFKREKKNSLLAKYSKRTSMFVNE